MAGEECEFLTPSCDPTSFWSYLILCVLLVCAAGMMAGLTIGLVSMDMLNVRILEMEGTEQEKKYASKVRPVVERHHHLLVTLLVVNASANEALPIFLDKLVPEGISILLSVTAVLMFGEIIPSAVFTGPNQLRIATAFCPAVRVLMILVSPVAYPISLLLDWWLGAEYDAAQYKRNELKVLVALQRESEAVRQSFAEARLMDSQFGSPRSSSSDTSVLMSPMTARKQPLLKPEPTDEAETPHQRKRRHQHALARDTRLNVDEVTIIHGALDLASKTVTEVMIPMSEVYMLEIDTQLDRDMMATILASGHSRIPVYKTRKSNIVGLLLVKKLIVLDPDDARPIGNVVQRKPILVEPSGSCYSILNEFQKGRSHIALVTKSTDVVAQCWREDRDVPANVIFEGIVTIEDVIEEIIQEEIEDESDVYVHDIVDYWNDKAQRSRLQTLAVKNRVTKRLKMLAERARLRVRTRRQAQLLTHGGASTPSPIQITVVPSTDSASRVG